MYKVSPDTVAELRKANATTLPDVVQHNTSYLFRHAGPAYTREQLRQQIKESKVFRVSRREALLWRSILQTCHPYWNRRRKDHQATFHGTSSVKKVVDSLPADDDEVGWLALVETCVQNASLSVEQENASSKDGVGERSVPEGAGSVQAKQNASGAYTETNEDIFLESPQQGGLHENGIITSGVVGVHQQEVTSKTLWRTAAKNMEGVHGGGGGMRGTEPAKGGPSGHGRKRGSGGAQAIIVEQNDPVNEFKNSKWLDAALHPYLIYNGGGGDLSRGEGIRGVSSQAMFRYDNKLMYREFANHPIRNFYLADVMNRHADLKNARFMVEQRGLRACRISTNELARWSRDLERGASREGTGNGNVVNLQRDLRAIGRMRRGSLFDRSSKKGHLDAYELTEGTASTCVCLQV